MHEVETYIRQAAARRRIDPDTAVCVARSEGGADAYARRGTFETGSSWWPFQLHYGGAGYEYLGTTAGMGNDFTRVTGWQPGDEAAWKDSVDFALDHASRYGWRAWYGARHVGIADWEGIGVDVPSPIEPTVQRTPEPDAKAEGQLAELRAKAEEQRVVIDHLTGRVAEALEQVRATMTVHDGAAADQLAAVVHRAYRELGNIKDELSRHGYAA